MIKFFALLLVTTTVSAYVPTVESVFRHGANPDVTANGISLSLVVKRIQPGESSTPAVNDVSLLRNEKVEDHYRIFFTKIGETLKVAQTRYSNGSYSQGSLEHKIYYPNFTAYTIKPSIEQAEKGIFFGLLQSIVLNDGQQLLNYLKALGIPVKLNNEIINREKVEFLADYKRYLVTISKDRNSRKTEMNPMRPEDNAARERADQIMAEPMYIDTKQVKLSRDEGQVAWVVNAGAFEAVASYRNRDIQRIKYRSPAGDFEIICKDYFLANGSHAVPRIMLVKGFNGQSYQVEITNLRHAMEKEDDLVKRLKNWDEILKGKESLEMRPEFLL
jgi:hypothetical protein